VSTLLSRTRRDDILLTDYREGAAPTTKEPAAPGSGWRALVAARAEGQRTSVTRSVPGSETGLFAAK
jgi:hypothetical protein